MGTGAALGPGDHLVGGYSDLCHGRTAVRRQARVSAAAAPGRLGGRRGRRRRPDPGKSAAALGGRRQPHLHLGQHRLCRLPDRRSRRPGPSGERPYRHAPGKGQGWRHPAVLRPRAGRGRRRTPAARERAAHGAGEAAVRRPLSAPGGHSRRHHPRRRGARALAAPHAGSPAAARVHRRGRRDGAHRRAGGMGVAHGLCAGGGVAGTFALSVAGGRQLLRTPAARTQPGRDHGAGPDGDRPGAGAARCGDHRDRHAGRRRGHDASPAAASRHGRRGVAG